MTQTYDIALLPGDGTGIEVAAQAERAFESLALSGSLVEGPEDAHVGQTSPAFFRLDARCRAPSEAPVVVRMRVERGAFDPLTFSLRPCAR